MNLNGIGNNTAIYGLYESLFQGSMARNNLRLSNSQYFRNKTQGSQGLGNDALQYVKGIKSASKNLSASLKGLSGTAFAGKGAVSSDTSVLTAKYTGNKPGEIKDTSVKVDQTAAGQVNSGKSLDGATSFGDIGTNRFSIESGGKTTELSVRVAAGDTNSNVQNKMADAINKAGIGVKASVETDAKTGATTLKLESAVTGANDKSKFSVNDVSGDLVARTGVGSVTSEARDAVYSVNGGEKQKSSSNTIDLGDGLSVTLLKASDEAVKISSGKNTDAAKSAVQDFVDSYNELYATAAEKTKDPKAQNLATRMLKTSKAYIGSLSDVGIGFDGDGKMTLDKTKMNEAAESGKLESFFTENSGKNFGFTNQLSKLASNVSNNTSNYVSKSVLGNELTENFSYSGLGNMLQYNYLNSGLLFDYSF